MGTVSALVAFMTIAQLWMPKFEMGRTWNMDVENRITVEQLEAAKAPCCDYVRNSDGTILRIEKKVWLVRVR